jgi:hypothetical protein
MQIAMSRRSRSRAPLAVAVLVAGLLVASCADGDRGEGSGSAVSADQFRQVPRGAAEGEIRYELGQPAAEHDVDGSHCLEYRESEGDGIGRPRMFRFCFRGGVLSVKRAY